MYDKPKSALRVSLTSMLNPFSNRLKQYLMWCAHPLTVKDTSGMCPLMTSTNNDDSFSKLISLFYPMTPKKSMPDPMVMRSNNFQDDCRIFDVTHVNWSYQPIRQLCHANTYNLCSLTYQKNSRSTVLTSKR
jgi:hypothetical protein